MRRNKKASQRRSIYRGVLKSPWLIIAPTAFVGFFVSLVFFYPGYRSPDSEWQLCQAIGECVLNNWHPISMALLWKILLQLTGGYVPMMLLVQLSMFWLGSALLSFWVWRKTYTWKLALLPLALGFLPNILGTIGVIWKDIQMASALLLALALVLNTYHKKIWIRVTGIILVFFLLAYATSVRSNAIAAVLPLAVMFVYAYNWPAKVYQKALVTLGVVLTLLSVNPILNRIYQPEHGPASSTMYAYDIVNILPASRITQEAPEQVRTSLMAFSGCSLENNKRTQLAFWSCISGDEVKSNFKGENLSILKSYWLDTVKSHPLQYIAQKIETYVQFIFPGDGQYIWSDGGDVFSADDGSGRARSFVSKAARSVNYGYTIDFGYKYLPFLFKAWFWLFAAGALMILLRKAKKYAMWVNGLCASAILYILSYAPGSLTSDYRYIFWSAIAVLVAGVLTAVSYWGIGKQAKK